MNMCVVCSLYPDARQNADPQQQIGPQRVREIARSLATNPKTAITRYLLSSYSWMTLTHAHTFPNVCATTHIRFGGISLQNHLDVFQLPARTGVQSDEWLLEHIRTRGASWLAIAPHLAFQHALPLAALRAIHGYLFGEGEGWRPVLQGIAQLVSMRRGIR